MLNESQTHPARLEKERTMKQRIRKAAGVISTIIVPSLILWACSSLVGPRPSLEPEVQSWDQAIAEARDSSAHWSDPTDVDTGGTTDYGESVQADGSPAVSDEYLDRTDPGDTSIDDPPDGLSQSGSEGSGGDSDTGGGTTPSTTPAPVPSTIPAPASARVPGLVSSRAQSPTAPSSTTSVAATVHPFTLRTGCGSLFVANPDSDGWRNLTWLTSGNHQMDILGLGWNPAESLGVLVKTDAFWFSVSCAGKVSTTAPETYAVTSCGTLKIVAGPVSRTRRVSWAADRQPGARFALGDQALTSSDSAKIRSKGVKFPLRVECASTQTLIVP